MAEEAKNSETSSLAFELDAALTTLEAALAEADRSVEAIRRNVSQIAALTELAREMEAAMSRARQNLGTLSPAEAPQVAISPLQPVPSQETPAEPSEHEAMTGEPAEPPAEPEPGRPPARCLRLDVNSKAGSLDLKAVDGSVGENPAVVDVALLDYDGRRATLELWIDASVDPEPVRQALLESLRSRLPEDQDADVHLEYEEKSAA